MMNQRKQKILREFAKLLQGLDVPVSMQMPIGAARDAYDVLKTEFKFFGWLTADEIFDAFLKAFNEADDESDPNENAHLSEIEREFIKLDKQKPEISAYYERLEIVVNQLVAEKGIEYMFYDDDGMIYETDNAKGTYVIYKKYCVNRTKRPGEAKATLTDKRIKEKGFIIPEKTEVKK